MALIMKPKITVLTCVYNGMPFLKEAIDSVLNQTYSDFEYLIIDDASTDRNVAKFIESYDDERIRFIKNEENLGVSKTFNKALSLINTQYVVRIDQDDVNLPDRIESQITYLENNNNIDIVCSWEHIIDSNGNKLGQWKRSLDNYGEFLGYVLIGICPIWHPSIAFRTKSMVDAGGFKVEYTRAEDFEVTARFALKRYGAAVVPKFLLLQRQHSDSQSVEFSVEQAQMTRRIHIEAIEFFSSHVDTKLVSDYLLLNINRGSIKFNKEYLKRAYNAMDELFDNIAKRQKLSIDELSSLKKVIYRRSGFGIKYTPIITKLPTLIFYIVFYILSPLQVGNAQEIVSKIYHRFMSYLNIFK